MTARRRIRKAAGLSIVEVCVLLVVMAALALVVLPRVIRSTAPMEARSYAETLAAYLRSAQAQAMSSGFPVAVVFPTNNGATSVCRGYYRLEGDHRPRITDSAMCPESPPDLGIFVGTYDAAPAPTRGAPFDPSLAIDLEHWAPPNPQDAHLIFSPSGTVHSNGLAKIGDSYHIVVADGLEVGGGAPPSGSPEVSWAANLQKLLATGPAHSVVVTESGAVTTERGVPHSSALLEHQDSPGLAGAALPPSRSLDPTTAPTAVDIRLTPDPSHITLPPGADALISEDGQLTVEIWADSPEGAPLTCLWASTGGAWSSASEQKMSWDDSKQAWKSVWTWMPDKGSAGTTFNLSCTIKDSAGQVAAAGALTSIMVPVTSAPSRLALASDRSGAKDIYLIRNDGTDIVHLGDGQGDNERGVPSPDGSKIIIESNRTGGSVGLYLYSMDGSLIGTLTDHPLGDWFSQWTADGTMIVFHSKRTGELKVYAMEARVGAPVIDLAPSLPKVLTHGLSPDSEHALLFTTGPSSDLYLAPLKPPGPAVQLTNFPGAEQNARFHPIDADRYIYGSNRTGTPRLYEGQISSPGVSVPLAPSLTAWSGLWDHNGKLWIVDTTDQLFEDGVATPILSNLLGAALVSGGGVFVNVGPLGSQEGYVVRSSTDVRNVTNSPADDYICSSGY